MSRPFLPTSCSVWACPEYPSCPEEGGEMLKERKRERERVVCGRASLIRLHTQQESSEINQSTSPSIHFSASSWPVYLFICYFRHYLFLLQINLRRILKLSTTAIFHLMYKSRVVMHTAEAQEFLRVFAAFEIKKSYISRAELVTHLNGLYWINSSLVSTRVSSLELSQQWHAVQYFILSQELGQNVLEFLQQARGKGGAVSKLMESMAADEDFEPNQDSSFSEDENPPMSAQPERPSTPGKTSSCAHTFQSARTQSPPPPFAIFNCCFMTKPDFIFLSMRAIINVRER